MGTGDFRCKLTAILSADVVGYSRLMGHDDAATVTTLRRYLEVMADFVAGHRGRVVDAPGDNLLAEFPSAVDAVRCAVEVQAELSTRNASLPEHRRMEFRIGVNLGDIIEEENRIYGDGVNIAARLESLAAAGGVSISGTVYDQVADRVPVEFEYQGEHSVKNIARPIRVYRAVTGHAPVAGDAADRSRRRAVILWASVVLLAVAVPAAGWLVFFRSTSGDVAATPDERPSLAVLPFDNMSGDPEQDYFSDGITEDLITDLSRVSGLHVAARNTTFAYKGGVADISRVGSELEVGYVLEGSVRREGDTVRINAQLIDVATGGHMWAERYDRDLDDIFAVQDEVVAEIVAALEVTLTDADEKRLERRQTDDLEAYDYAKQGFWYYNQLTRESNAQARAMFTRAIDIDPGYAQAYAGLGFTYYEEWAQLWTTDSGVLDEAYGHATTALELDPNHGGAHVLLSHVYLWTDRHDLAIAELESALALSPTSGDMHRDLAEALVFAERPEEAIPHAEEAMRLNPHYPVTYPFTLGFALVTMGDYQAGIGILEESLDLNPVFLGSHIVLAVAYNETGHPGEAGDHVAQAPSTSTLRSRWRAWPNACRSPMR